jgi:hypothetical protein
VAFLGIPFFGVMPFLKSILLCAIGGAVVSVGCDRSSPLVTRESTASTGTLDRGGSLIYVPAYTYATPGGGRKIKLATTLTIHNVSSRSRIALRSVEYHDAPGTKIMSYLPSPQVLEPLQTAEFVVNEPDDAPGAGANFIVSYDVTEGVAPPLVEAVMVGNAGTGWLSFTSRGVPVEP